MLYIDPIEAYNDIKDDLDEDWVDDLRIELDDYESTVEQLYVKLLSDFLKDLAIQSLSDPQNDFQLNLARVVDENGKVVYKTFHATVQGVAEDSDGNTVYFTPAGAITVLKNIPKQLSSPRRRAESLNNKTDEVVDS